MYTYCLGGGDHLQVLLLDRAGRFVRPSGDDLQASLAAPGPGGGIILDLDLVLGGKVPVQDEALLHADGTTSTDANHVVAPVAERPLAPVLDADVAAADEGGVPVHDQELAMVAVVDAQVQG